MTFTCNRVVHCKKKIAPLTEIHYETINIKDLKPFNLKKLKALTQSFIHLKASYMPVFK